MSRAHRAGGSIEDYCRACKTDRMHTVVAADPAGLPIRTVCGFCGSEHNFRGGPRIGQNDQPARSGPRAPAPRAVRPDREPFAMVSERERSAPAMSLPVPGGEVDLEMLLRRIIREEAGVTPAVPADKWRNGSLVLRPGNPELQEKTWPIETVFHKIVMVRNRLRTLEQQVNAAELPADLKVRLQGYISGCYGSLTSFNVLFADKEDEFRGSGAD